MQGQQFLVFDHKLFTSEDLVKFLQQNYSIANGKLQSKQKIVIFIEDFQE